jgi:DNA-binding CsgD family transcriptional regulator
MPAHRVAWFLEHGSIPAGQHVLHRCDNRLCCNPAHLFLGTNLDNIADRHAKGRTARGSDNGRARLTPDAVIIVRRLASHGATKASLARRFAVSETTIRQAVQRKTWKHLDSGGAS